MPDPVTKQQGHILMMEVGPARGLKGEVLARVYAEDPGLLLDIGRLCDADGGNRLTLSSLKSFKKGFVARFKEIGDRNGAEALRGRQLFVAREDLPPPEADEFYHSDLIGLIARDPSGDNLGTVTGLFDFGAGDLIEVRLDDGKKHLLPFTMDVVPSIDLAARSLTLIPPTGFLDDEKEDNTEIDEGHSS